MFSARGNDGSLRISRPTSLMPPSSSCRTDESTNKGDTLHAMNSVISYIMRRCLLLTEHAWQPPLPLEMDKACVVQTNLSNILMSHPL